MSWYWIVYWIFILLSLLLSITTIIASGLKRNKSVALLGLGHLLCLVITLALENNFNLIGKRKNYSEGNFINCTDISFCIIDKK
ncbi:hypothetical protein RDV78_10925 [Bacillota bacterium LX-D]|nr:hypothetical protein [Bacillota bacterium LX-D]